MPPVHRFPTRPAGTEVAVWVLCYRDSPEVVAQEIEPLALVCQLDHRRLGRREFQAQVAQGIAQDLQRLVRLPVLPGQDH